MRRQDKSRPFKYLHLLEGYRSTKTERLASYLPKGRIWVLRQVRWENGHNDQKCFVHPAAGFQEKHFADRYPEEEP